jgi:hypothetical protein
MCFHFVFFIQTESLQIVAVVVISVAKLEKKNHMELLLYFFTDINGNYMFFFCINITPLLTGAKLCNLYLGCI